MPNRNLEGYGRKETQPLNSTVKWRGQQNKKSFVVLWKLRADHFYQINAVVVETTQIADTFVDFCFTEKLKFFGERSSYINLLWSASYNHDNLFQKLVIIENTISMLSTKHSYKKPFSYTLIVNMLPSHSLLHWGELAVVSTHFLISCLQIMSINSLWLTDM